MSVKARRSSRASSCSRPTIGRSRMRWDSARSRVILPCRFAPASPRGWACGLGYHGRPHTDRDMARLRDQGIDAPRDDPNVAIDPIDEAGPEFWFCRVPEQKSVKNRVHVDVYGDVDEVARQGATLI